MSRSVYHVSIRALADFCLNTGHLVSQYRASVSSLEGQLTHQRLQRNYGADRQAEVPIQFEWVHPDFSLIVSGRIDGLFSDGIEEIKATRVSPDELPSSVTALHRLQAELYAAVVASDLALDTLQVVIKYVHPQTDKTWPVRFKRKKLELIDLLIDCCLRYEHWLTLYRSQRLQRQAYLTALQFPFSHMRDSQRKMAEAVYKSAILNRHATIEAPTGTGKSLAALFPALKAMTHKAIDSAFYLTMKNTGQQSAKKAIEQLDQQQQLTVVQLQAKEKLCLSIESPCDGELCPYAQDYFTKRDRVRVQLFTQQHWWVDELKRLGESESICPYYLSQDWAIWADVIVADINYIYDTTAVQPLLLKEIKNNATILIDEAHNLVSRGRNIYSTELKGENISALAKQCPKAIKAELNKLQNALRTECKEALPYYVDSPPSKILIKLKDFIARSAMLLREVPFFSPPQQWQNFLFEASRFVRLHELANSEDFAWRYTNGRAGERKIELACLNPASLLKQKHSLVNNVVAFSATLKPIHYSNRLNGLDDSIFIDLPPAFSPEQYQVTLLNDVSTRHKDKAALPNQLRPLLESVIKNDRNSIVFFSSYQQLLTCADALPNQDISRVYTQQIAWSETERNDMLNRFINQRGITLLAVLGGVFSEGIDLTGDKLSEVLVVGPGLPQVNLLNNKIRSTLDRQFGSGFDLAYTYPGLQKTLQAAGRAVRTETDIGNILLIDDRFHQYWHQGLLPHYWTVRSVPLQSYLSDHSLKNRTSYTL